jgi:hypothetical protein
MQRCQCFFKWVLRHFVANELGNGARPRQIAFDEQVDLFIRYLTSLSNKEKLQSSGGLSRCIWLHRIWLKNFCLPAWMSLYSSSARTPA